MKEYRFNLPLAIALTLLAYFVVNLILFYFRGPVRVKTGLTPSKQAVLEKCIGLKFPNGSKIEEYRYLSFQDTTVQIKAIIPSSEKETFINNVTFKHKSFGPEDTTIPSITDYVNEKFTRWQIDKVIKDTDKDYNVTILVLKDVNGFFRVYIDISQVSTSLPKELRDISL